MVAALVKVLVLVVKLQLMVPASVPLAGEIVSQLMTGVTAADQSMVPVPVLETLNVAVPASLVTFRLVGEITKLANDADCPPRTART
jgi:hypothetical protein